jgi:GrpB-like predicted nucleotidyltransferase (UPF0157 family)
MASIHVVPYDASWPERFEAERRLLAELLEPWLVGPVEHIGSTAVPGLAAKPVIDILGPVRDLDSSRSAIEALRALSYRYCEYRADVMHWFCKPSDDERTHHLHLVPFGSPLWHARLHFRDALRADAALAAEYRALKLGLAELHRTDRDAYTDAKAPFVERVLADVARRKEAAGGRHS